MEKGLERFCQNKIKGAIAEACVREHFELMGYRCDNTGIENIANSYIALEQQDWGNSEWGNYSESIREKYRGLPDFIISRKHPELNLDLDEHKSIRGKSNFGKSEVLFVEAKYRSNADLDKLRETFAKQYGHFGNVIIYLVANGWKKGKKSSEELTVWLISLAHQEKQKNPWWEAGGKKFDGTLLYAGSHPDRSFNKAYNNVIKPVLDDLVKSRNK